MRAMFKIFVGLLALWSCSSDEADKGRVSLAVRGNVPQIYDVRPLSSTDMFLISPKFSPDGRTILATGEKFKGLFLLTLDGTVRRIAEDDISGWQAKFLGDSIIAFDSSRKPVVLAPPEYKVVREAHLVSEYPLVSQREDSIFLDDGVQEIKISTGNDKFYLPVLSPSKDAIVFEGLNTGIYIYEVKTRKTTHIGKGNHPSWLPDGLGILYDVSEDNGMTILSSDIYLALRDGRKFKLTDTKDIKEMMPVASPDMSLVAFESEGQIFVGRLRLSGLK